MESCGDEFSEKVWNKEKRNMNKLGIEQLLSLLVSEKGSDLHISPGNVPRIRRHGALKPIEDHKTLTGDESEEMLFQILTEIQKTELKAKLSLDFSFGLKSIARFRANFFMKEDGWAGVFRVIPYEISSFEDLGLPAVVADLCNKPRGLVLVTGPTGSGKSTTLAAMIDKINRERYEHILTIEDPIEFVHPSKRSLVNQREVGSHVPGFAEALRASLREDPDVVLIGEMRDPETIEMALRTAETGHLTFGTLHTNSASSTINRIIDSFPANQQGQIKAQLSVSLEGVLSQTLLPRRDGTGRAMALEVMIGTDGIRNLIRESKVEQMYSMIQSGFEDYKMQTMEMSLAKLIFDGKIDEKTAFEKSSRPEVLKSLVLSGGGALVKNSGSAKSQLMTDGIGL